jgi:hypothetical protein
MIMGIMRPRAFCRSTPLHSKKCLKGSAHTPLDKLIAESRSLRQDELTSEIVELSSLTLAAVPHATPRRKRHPVKPVSPRRG